MLLRAAIELVDSELALLRMRAENPALFTNEKAVVVSELFWCPDFTKRDLVELLTALELLQSIRMADGKAIPFSRLVA